VGSFTKCIENIQDSIQIRCTGKDKRNV